MNTIVMMLAVFLLLTSIPAMAETTEAGSTEKVVTSPPIACIALAGYDCDRPWQSQYRPPINPPIYRPPFCALVDDGNNWDWCQLPIATTQ